MADDQGRFVFTGLPAGQYRVLSDQFGYVYGSSVRRASPAMPLPIDLTDGQRFTEATILMWRFVSLSGRVVDEAGEPMVGVRVFALGRSVRNGQAVLEPAFDGGAIRYFVTDDRGVYRASLLPPGDYTIAVPATVSTFPVDVIRDAQTSRIDLGVNETSPLGSFKNLQIGNQILTTMSQAPIPPARDGSPVTVYETTVLSERHLRRPGHGPIARAWRESIQRQHSNDGQADRACVRPAAGPGRPLATHAIPTQSRWRHERNRVPGPRGCQRNHGRARAVRPAGCATRVVHSPSRRVAPRGVTRCTANTPVSRTRAHDR
jgi:hypothetical protein